MVKINIRTVKQQKFEINIEGNETVAHLKELIEQQEHFDRSTITLIFAGKFMDDTKMISEYNITEKDFVVLTVKPTKSSPQPKTQTQTQTNQTRTQGQTNTQTQGQTTTQTQTQGQTNTQTQGQTNTQTQQDQGQNQGQTNTQTQQDQGQTQTQNQPQEPSEELIAQVSAMGFPRDEVIRALKLSGNNAPRAVDILTGIAFGTEEEVWDEGEPEGISGGTGGVQGGNVFDTLRNHPVFIQMRALVQSNPSYLEELLGNIANQSP